MTDPNVPGDSAADATPTEALHLADQQPVEPAPAPAAAPAAAPAKASHTRTILEVVGGVVAAALIVMAGVAGFALGHATGDDDRGEWAAIGQGYGQDGSGQQGFGPGRDRHDGDRDRGHGGGFRGDDDGDGFMRADPEGMPGQQMPGQQPAPQG